MSGADNLQLLLLNVRHLFCPELRPTSFKEAMNLIEGIKASFYVPSHNGEDFAGRIALICETTLA